MSDSDEGAPRSALWVGFGSAVLLVVLESLYALALFLGLSALEEPSEPIGDPYFSVMEILILLIMPVMVSLAVSVQATCAANRRHFALAAVVFVAISTAITSSVHASVLFLSRDPAFAGLDHVFSFEWPSVVYVLDILAWDFFFAFFAICLALSFERGGVEGWARRLLLLSGVLAFLGLWGAAIGDMAVRNIGIVGYVGVFTLGMCPLALRMWRRARPSRQGS